MALDSVADVIGGLAGRDHLVDEPLATAVFLALRKQRPLLLEGGPRVGKTEVARALATWLGVPLIRLRDRLLPWVFVAPASALLLAYLVPVSLRVPADLAHQPEGTTHLATYSILPPSLAALAAVLVGQAHAPGRLPIPVGDLPRGHRWSSP